MKILRVVILLALHPLLICADIAEEALKIHNKYRSWHHTPALVMDEVLNVQCQQYANALAKHQSNIESDNRGMYGENLCKTPETPLSCIKDWYEENTAYDWRYHTPRSASRHFSQLIWKNSLRMGFGVASNKTRGYSYVVARYAPKGNIRGEYRDNVPALYSTNGLGSKSYAWFLLSFGLLLNISW